MSVREEARIRASVMRGSAGGPAHTGARQWRRVYALFSLLPALLAAPLLHPGANAQSQPRHAGIMPLTNLAADTVRAKKEHLPILVLVSIAHCPYCEQIRRSHLIPLSRQANAGVLIREVDLRSSQLIKEPVNAGTQAQWAQRYGARVAPTVLLIGPSGELLAEPLVGASIPDFYGAYLTERIETAKRKLGAS